jgi:Ca2+-binding RTX toxin-like protein
METTEESYGGNNTIDLGLRSTSGDVVFGGIGANNIELGNGNNIVLGHLGVVDLSNLLNYTSLQRDAGNLPDIWARVVPEIGNIAPVSASGSERLNTIALTGNDRILVGNGNNVVMGGGGNNLITTGAGVDVVFGAAGSVSRDARSLAVMYATTVEESLGGNDILNIGNSARNNDTVFGGAGNDRINVGAGNNVVFGHLGQVDMYAIEGIGVQGADLLGRTIPVIANVSPVSTGPWAGIGHKLSTSGDTITAGNGNNIIEGGAGNNTLNVGNGNNVLVGASASITRNPTSLQEVSYTKTEIGKGGTNTYIHGTGTNLIINDPISNTVPARVVQSAPQKPLVHIGVASSSGVIHGNEQSAPGNAPITQHAQTPPAQSVAAVITPMHVVSGSHTLASGNDLLQLAMALQASTPPAAQAVSYVLDESSGQWIEDEDDGEEPLLIGLSSRPELLLNATHKMRAAA